MTLSPKAVEIIPASVRESARHGRQAADARVGYPQRNIGMGADYIVVEMARHILGEGWMEDSVRRANTDGIERVLV